VRESSARRDAGGFVRPGTSLVIGLGLLGVSFWLGRRLPLEHAAHVFALSVGFFGLFSGVFLIVARRTALMQALGYLVLENGIYLVGATLVAHTPFLLEVGLLLDVVLAVLVMGATIFRMNRELEHMDTEQLLKLQG
jgi:hydrogenase-4 component E